MQYIYTILIEKPQTQMKNTRRILEVEFLVCILVDGEAVESEVHPVVRTSTRSSLTHERISAINVKLHRQRHSIAANIVKKENSFLIRHVFLTD